MEKYEPQKIEKKWQEIWQKTKLYETDIKHNKPKHYNLVMFPYPSGEYLHMGHGYSYSGADVYGRFKTLRGFNLFEPIGYDSFGLPAENYAIKKDIHPKDSTIANIEHAQKQLKSFGCAFDWSHTVTTSNPEYYKWTQWIFLKLYQQGLAYQKEAPVNWCPKCMTVLANEQVINGFCERCDSEVVQKNMKQWFFKITDYADRLVADLDKVDWPKSSVVKQRNWIGRSEGVEIQFRIKNTKYKINVFTTRVDTIFGATYMVVAPEHEIIKNLKYKIQNWNEVQGYILKAQKKTELERMMQADTPTFVKKSGDEVGVPIAKRVGKKTGVELKGLKAINPFNKEEIPIYIADYIIGGYGTGAIMAVPAHDERDFEFAQKYKLPVREVVVPYFKYPTKKDKSTEKRSLAMAIIHNKKDDTYLCLDWTKTKWRSFPGGGVDGEDYVSAAKREVLEETGYKNIRLVKEFRNTIIEEFYRPHKDSNVIVRYKYLIFDLVNNEKESVSEKESSQHKNVWVKKDKVADFINIKHIKEFWEKYISGEEEKIFTDHGTLIDSGEYSGLISKEAKEKMVAYLSRNNIGKAKANYKLRDWSFSRQRYWGAPIPIVYCEKCGTAPVPEKDLPVKLPELDIKQVRPTGTGKGPLANVPEFVSVECPKCGGRAERETDTMDTFVCSSFYYLRYPSVGNNDEMMEKETTKKWLPVDMYVGGAEHVTMHLLYSRFVTKALFDANLISFDEPFKSLRHQGMILGSDGKKMSKSKGNTVIPDKVIHEYGADIFRTYLLFMGPFEDGGPWNPKGIVGVKRFVERFFSLACEVAQVYGDIMPEKLIYSSLEIEETALMRVVQKTAKKVSEDIEEFRFNTAVSAMMECVNEVIKIKGKLPPKDSPTVWKDAISQMTIILSPFAPHIAEELWERLGHPESIFTKQWPEVNQQLIQEDIVTIVVQVNGKVRGSFECLKDTNQEEVKFLAIEIPNVKKYLKDISITKIIYVKNKLINLIV